MTSNERIVRTQAQQVGPFTGSNNNVDIRMNGGQVVNMAKSYLEVELRANIIPATSDTDSAGIYDVQIQFGVSNESPAFNVGLIRNCRLSSQMQGTLEEINRVDILKTNLNNITMSRDEKLSLSVASLAQNKNYGKQRYGIFTDLLSEGTTKSKQVIPQVKIPLSQLYGLGEQSQLDLNRTGDLNFHVELNNAVDFLLATIPTDNYDASMLPINATGSLSGIVPAGTGTLLSVELGMKFETLDQLPFWVGQHCTISGTPASTGGGVPVPQLNKGSQIITGISRAATTGIVTLTFGTSILTTLTGQSWSNLICTPDVTGAAATISIENVSLVSTELMNASPSGQVSYFTYETEQMTSSTTGVSTSQIFTLPPDCINYFAMFPLVGTLVSSFTNPKDYRNRLDNNQETSRPVEFDSPLYYEQIRRTLINGGMRLRDLNLQTNVTVDPNASISGGAIWNMVMNATPQTKENKILQMNINVKSTPSPGSINLYKQIVKVL